MARERVKVVDREEMTRISRESVLLGAGGGRAGCSAKNLYGAVKLSREVTERLE